MGLSAVSYQAGFRKGDKADGPGEGPLTRLVVGSVGGCAEPWAGRPGSQPKAPPSWAPGFGVCDESVVCKALLLALDRTPNAALPP